MLLKEYIKIQSIALHNVGNKLNEEGVHFSKSALRLNENIESILQKYFLSPFKVDEYYNLYHDSNIQLNEVYSYISEIFSNQDTFFNQSISLAKHLYNQSIHPKIKGGEFYVTYLSDCIIDGETVDAVGLFKSESKDTYLKVISKDGNYNIESENGVNINKLDKGCIIFNTEKDKGFLVAVVDNINKGTEAQYWLDNFLCVRQREDKYFQTQNLLRLCKSFVTEKLPDEFEVNKANQADLLTKSIKFFKENDNFNLNEFTNEVIQQPEIIKSFKKYKNEYEKEQEFEISNSFEISESAVKKQARALKSVIKLDKNFHIYVHGNTENIIKGFDKETGLHFYQLFFKEEN